MLKLINKFKFYTSKIYILHIIFFKFFIVLKLILSIELLINLSKKYVKVTSDYNDTIDKSPLFPDP